MNAAPALEGRVALVTGAGGTMGRAVVQALRADGCRVAMVDLRESSMDGLARELAPHGVTANAIAPAYVRFLASPLWGFITGEVLDLHGGLLMD